MFNDSMLFIGLDLGDRMSDLILLDPEGELIEESRLPTSPASFQQKVSALPAARVALEVGAHSCWVSQLLQELGHEVLVANARKLRAIYANPRKSDRTDAETLARRPDSTPACSPPFTTAQPRLKPTWPSSVHPESEAIRAHGMPWCAPGPC